MKFTPGFTDFFMSPVTGKMTSYLQLPPLQNFYVFEGDATGQPQPSPALIDLRLDIIELRRGINDSNYLPENYIYRGNASNVATPYPIILLGNMADLSTGKVWIGDGSNRPVESAFTPLSSYLPEGQVFVGDSSDIATPSQLISIDNLPDLGMFSNIFGDYPLIWAGTPDGRPEVSSILAFILPALDILGARVDDLQDEVDAIEDNINDIEDDVDELETDVAILEAKVDELFVITAALQAEIGSLYAITGIMATEIAVLQIDVGILGNRLDNLKLNEIPADGDVSLYNHKLTDVEDPSSAQDAATKIYVDTAISGIPGSTTLTFVGDVTGSGLISSSITLSIGAGVVTNAMLDTISSSNTAGAIVVRDGSGNFGAGTISNTKSVITNNSGSLSLGSHLLIGDLGAAANNRYWNFTTSGTSLYGFAMDDVPTGGTTWLQVNRTGPIIDRIYFVNAPVNITSIPYSSLVATDGSGDLVAASGTYSITGLNLSGLTVSSLVATNGSKDLISASGGTYNISISGNAATATTATTSTNVTNVNITDDTTTSADMYPVWVTANSGDLPMKVSSTKLKFVPSTGTLSSTIFSGALSGNATTATTATNIATTANTTNASFYIPFCASSSTSNQAAQITSSLFYNPSTKQMTIQGDSQTGLTLEATTGEANLTIKRAASSNYAQVLFNEGSSNKWAIGMRSGDYRLYIYDVVNGGQVLAIAPGTPAVINMTTLTASSLMATDASKNLISASGGTYNISISGNSSTVTNGIYTTDTGTVTNTMLAGSIADTKLSTISTASKVSNSATTATSANTASAIVARDGSGNFSAGVITATSLTLGAGSASFAPTDAMPIFGNRAWVNFNGTSAANVAVTYGRVTTTVTVTLNSHGYVVGNRIYLAVTSGTLASGEYTIVSVATNTFTFTAASGTDTAPQNATIQRRTINASGNIRDVCYVSAGIYIVNWSTAFPNGNYCVLATSNGSGGGSDFARLNNGDTPQAGYVKIQNMRPGTSPSLDASYIGVSAIY
jgi:hypothetical protein